VHQYAPVLRLAVVGGGESERACSMYRQCSIRSTCLRDCHAHACILPAWSHVRACNAASMGYVTTLPLLRTPCLGADACDAWFVVFRSARSSGGCSSSTTSRRLILGLSKQPVMATDDTAIANGAAMPDSCARTKRNVCKCCFRTTRVPAWARLARVHSLVLPLLCCIAYKPLTERLPVQPRVTDRRCNVTQLRARCS